MKLRTLSATFAILLAIDGLFVAYLAFAPETIRAGFEQQIHPTLTTLLPASIVDSAFPLTVLISFVYAVIVGALFLRSIVRHFFGRQLSEVRDVER